MQMQKAKPIWRTICTLTAAFAGRPVCQDIWSLSSSSSGTVGGQLARRLCSYLKAQAKQLVARSQRRPHDLYHKQATNGRAGTQTERGRGRDRQSEREREKQCLLEPVQTFIANCRKDICINLTKPQNSHASKQINSPNDHSHMDKHTHTIADTHTYIQAHIHTHTLACICQYVLSALAVCQQISDLTAFCFP